MITHHTSVAADSQLEKYENQVIQIDAAINEISKFITSTTNNNIDILDDTFDDYITAITLLKSQKKELKERIHAIEKQKEKEQTGHKIITVMDYSELIDIEEWYTFMPGDIIFCIQDENCYYYTSNKGWMPIGIL